MLEAELRKMISFDLLMTLEYSPEEDAFRGTASAQRLYIVPDNPMHALIKTMGRVQATNSIRVNDLFAKGLEDLVKRRVANYMVVPVRNVAGTVEEMLVLINKSGSFGGTSTPSQGSQQPLGFVREEELIAEFFVNLIALVKKFECLRKDYDHQISLKTKVYRHFEDLISCVSTVFGIVRKPSAN